VRLLLASGTPELSPEPDGFPARLEAVWERVHQLVQARHHVGRARAQELTEHLLAALLGEECCRQSVRRTVPLAQALGRWRVLHRLRAQQRWARRRLAAGH
jgi:hypothetical protein